MRKNYRPIYIINMNTKILKKKILANQIQLYSKRIIQHDQVEFIPETQGWLNIQKSITVIYHNDRKTKSQDHLNRHRENI